MSKPQSIKNRIIVASAGSRKTTMIVEEAISLGPKRVLITTYTNENLDQIREYFVEKHGCVPGHVTLVSWFGFLLQDGVKPYQLSVLKTGRIKSICFDQLPYVSRYAGKAKPEQYYLTRNADIYRDRVSEFACAGDDNSGGLVIKRLAKIYQHIFIDELQDVAGHDLVFLEKIFNSGIIVTGVCDPRQGTFTTNNSAKNKRFRKSGILDWIYDHQKNGLVGVEERNECFRCNQAICDFADSLFPEFPKTISMNVTATGHDGIVTIKPDDVLGYVSLHKPVALRWNKKTNTMGLPALNFGISKGRTFDRVLIFPTGPMKAFLTDKNVEQAGDVSKFYVAVTRARHSVAFVVG